jgi:hypothetical protein
MELEKIIKIQIPIIQIKGNNVSEVCINTKLELYKMSVKFL